MEGGCVNSPSSPEPVEDSLDQCSLDSEQLPLLKSTPIASESSARGAAMWPTPKATNHKEGTSPRTLEMVLGGTAEASLARVVLIHSRSMAISAPSTPSPAPATSSPADSPASRSVRLGSEKARMTVGICGQKCSESSLKRTLDTSSARTYPAFSVPDAEVAYAAGLIDGEGCINIYLNRRNNLDFHYVRLTVQLSYKGLTTLKRMQSVFGGSIASRMEKRTNTPFYVWRMGQKDACRLMWAMLPYLTIKRQCALLALHFYENCQAPLDDEKRSCAAHCKQAMHRLNKTGMPDFPEGAFAQLVGEDWVTSRMTLEGMPEQFSGPWPASGSMRSGACWEQTMSVPRIDGSGCGFWPTPRLHEAGRTIKIYPGTVSGKSHARMANGGHGDLVEEVARGGATRQTWGTPRSSPAMVSGTMEQIRRTMRTTGHQNRLEEGVASTTTDGTNGSLNPTWVEWLQGWPRGWTDCEHSVMDRCLSAWRRRSRTWLTLLGYIGGEDD